MLKIDKIEEFATSDKLKNNVVDFLLRAICRNFGGVFFEFEHFDDVCMVNIFDCFNFIAEKLNSLACDTRV